MKKNTRKYNCPFCKVCSGCNHKEGCREINRLKEGKRVIEYNSGKITIVKKNKK